MSIPATLFAEPDELYVELSPTSPPFPAIVDHTRSNGWARPHFRRTAAEAVLAWLNNEQQHNMPPVAVGHFDGDTAVLRDATGNRSCVTADPRGRFALGAGTWHWFISAPYTDPEAEAALLADHERLVPQEGEGLVTITMEGSDPAFPALLTDGWANPLFRRSVAEVVVAWTNATYRKYPDGSDRAYWEGDTIVHIYSGHIHEDGYAPVRIQPDDNGRYRIGSYWAWEKVGHSRQ